MEYCADASTEHLYSTLAGDEIFIELIELFVGEMPTRIAQLGSLFTNREFAELCRAAHQLKGSAGSYGFPQLTEIAAELEGAIKNGAPLDEIQTNLDKLGDVCSRMRPGLPG